MNITIPGYKIEHLIAEGGTSSVYLAVQESLHRHVAIKLLRKFDNQEQLTRFLNEGQIIASLNHRNVINIHDIGVTDGGRPYISMEYLEGGDLDARIPNRVDPEEALQWLEAIGNCLDFVHRKGILHRDIKPGNILFHKDGTPILTDFGTAKQQESDARLTMDGRAFGSPYYISPEQAASKKLDRRTDIYSLGIVLYEMLTGNKPYQGDSHIETIVAHMSEPLPDLPPELRRYQTLIKRMIAKSPDDRFASAAEMVRFVQQLQIPEKPPWPALRPPVNLAAITANTAHTVRQWLNRVKQVQRMTWAYTGGVAVILGIAATVFIAQSGTSARNTHRAIAGTTASERTITENAADIMEAPGQPPADPARETVSAPKRDVHPASPGVMVSEETAPESSDVIAEAPATEPDHPVKAPAAPSITKEQRIDQLLSQAATALKEYRLTKPENSNAYAYYQQVLELQPQHKKALEGITGIAEAYADLADRKLDQYAYDAARKLVQRGLMIQPDNTRLTGLQKKAGIGKILAQADTALEEQRLTKPRNNNAYAYYRQVLDLQPQHQKALEGITRVADAYADLAESKLDKFEYKAARAYVNRGLEVQPENTRLLALQKNTNAFRDAPKRVWKKILSPFSKAF